MRTLPYLTFDGTTREAMEHYQQVLGGTLDVRTFAEGGAVEAGQPHADKVMHAALVAGNVRLYASDHVPDFCGGAPFQAGSDVDSTLEGPESDAEALRAAFAGLSEGGEIYMPLEMQMWGDEFGSFRDKFGKGWNIAIAIASDVE